MSVLKRTYTASLTCATEVTARVFQNELGFDFVFTRLGVGEYLATPNDGSQIPEHKTVVTIECGPDGSAGSFFDNGSIHLASKNGSAQPEDGLIYESCFHVEIYF